MYGILAVLALVLLAVPLITLGAAAARLTSRRRNDRLATLRLLGASTRELWSLTVLEATTIAAAGAVAGSPSTLRSSPSWGCCRSSAARWASGPWSSIRCWAPGWWHPWCSSVRSARPRACARSP